MMNKSLLKLERLVKDILVLTEIRNKEDNTELTDIETLFTESFEKLSNLTGADDIDIQFKLKLKQLRVDKVKLQAIADNLLSNAIKYRDTKKHQSYIRISTYREGSDIVLEVKDNGLGIPKEKEKDLFKMFKRFHPKVSFGSGLGLYLVKKSADALQAQITFERHELGSIFRLNIPINDKVTCIEKR